MDDTNERVEQKKAGPSIWWKLLRILGISYGVVLLLLMALETRLVYPGAYMDSEQSLQTLTDSRIETVSYQAADGVPCTGRLFEKTDAVNVVLYFHGNGDKAVWNDYTLEHFSRQFDAIAMAAEYRGFDDDVYTPSEAGLVADSIAARDYLCERFGRSPRQIILYGQSLGGGCAAAVAEQGGAQCLILDRSFDRLVDVAAGMYLYFPIRLVMRNRYDSVKRLAHYKGTLIQIHGTDDGLIPIKHARNLFDSVPSEDKEWIQVDGLGHNGALPREVEQQISEKVMGPR